MNDTRWGIVGFGEVGSTFARHISGYLSEPLYVTDPVLNRAPLPDHIQERLVDLPAEIIADVPHLAPRCDIVLSLVTPSVAPSVAAAAGPAQQQGLFIDFNSVSPAEKRHMATFFENDSYVDGAILGPIAGAGASVPLALAGPLAKQACAWLRDVGFNVSVVGPEVGGAAALKMCRSIFMKGVECLFVEALLVAAQFNIDDSLLGSIEETFTSYGVRPLANMLVSTHAVHCGRRAAEMQQAREMLEDMQMPHHMSAASRDSLTASYRTGVTDYFGGVMPDNPGDVISYLRHFHEEGLS